MIDTIALTLDEREFEILEPGRFSPSAAGLLAPPYYPLGGRGNVQCVQNPTKVDLQEGRYLPRLTLSRRRNRGGFTLTLRIEFSAPKLVFGNNFDELTARDFERVLAALQRGLALMSVRVDEAVLRASRVSAVHYGKNIAFTDYTTCSMVMSELERIDLNRRLDLSKTDYRDEGHAIRYHANSYEVTFYDKLKDIQKARVSEKRAIERDYGAQIGLFDRRDRFPKNLEVLRMEVRLGSRAKIRALLNKVEPEAEPTFAALFSAGIARDVLQHFWKQVRAQMPLVERVREMRPEDLLSLVVEMGVGRLRPGALLQQLGCLVLVGSVGFRGAGALMTRHCSARSWQRYRRQIRALPDDAGSGFSALRLVDEALSRFQPLRFADFHGTSSAGSIRPISGHSCSNRGRK